MAREITDSLDFVFSVLAVVQVVLRVLRVVGLIDWPLVWVIAPILAMLVFFVGVFLAMAWTVK